MSKYIETAKAKELYFMALEAANNAYAPYSNFKVGSALLSKDGKVFTGCNVENASYAVTCCAERNAVFQAINSGHREFTAIAVAALEERTAWPCGMCRQCLVEFSPEMDVIVGSSADNIEIMKAKDLIINHFKI